MPHTQPEHSDNHRNDDDDAPHVVVENHASHRQPQGTIASSVINITNTILGSGMLAMPSAVSRVGLLLGVLIILFSAFASGFGLLLLSICAAKLGGRQSSFFSIASVTYPSAAIYFDFAIAIKCFGVSISYLVITGSLMPKVVDGFFPLLDSASAWRTKELWIVIGLLIVTPFCFAKRLDSLRYTSALALGAVVYLLFIVIYYALSPSPEMPPKIPWGDIRWANLDLSFWKTLPIFVFAFTCHQNIFAVYNEIRDNTIGRMSKVIVASIGTSFTVYELIGVIGYITFGNNVSDNVISMYPPGNTVTGGQLAIAILVLLSYPLQCHPCRNSLEKVLSHYQKRRHVEREGQGAIEPEHISPLLPAGSAEQGASPRRQFEIDARLLTVGIIISTLVIALVVHDLSTVLAFVGATGSTTICYILPGLFYYRLRQVMDRPDEATKWDIMKVGAVALAGWGMFVMVLSLSLQISGAGGGH
ncbi:vacuolar amino acid transporter 5 [Polychytrium aggregatum]|uniref:vacuolar amino acid transporter 5 n=1 Tax=Polychytrium aggregatum TaxID=110093 RepID=UPI0022FE2BBA|nr:vacuolar amino acid transporter 5 [Polychytrium aggregatum]KAI9209651.1 vacuolar amino acid transporter 5 [Polychytrium aggregatum]